MRRGQQPRMHRTPHTTHNTQPCRNNNNTQMEEEGEANRSGTQGSSACTYGENGPSCRHPSRRAHTRE
ncbi:hypothetical protein MOQ_002042 [Trypanosoma cruzi marinkellei]|uniref:Uncharacterized protein n=1 Tax=Trypanosoma cruzi marinkellei TaxID=85056 RepID=K2P9I5_TRYCR|nr:hypothetical protein MOQ_002042 [Trypanosoma cruzi marinkellei]